jgi:hypothetical protein
MNFVQYESVKAVLAGDCAISAKYIDERGRTCAIGALAMEAGVPKQVLRQARSADIDFGRACDEEEYQAIKEIRKAIRARFGLTTRQMQQIQNANDSISDWSWSFRVTPAERRRRVALRREAVLMAVRAPRRKAAVDA